MSVYQTFDQPSLSIARKTKATGWGGLVGIFVAPEFVEALVGILNAFGVDVPPEVIVHLDTIFVAVAAFLASYSTRERVPFIEQEF